MPGLGKILRRDIGSQIRTSKNLNEKASKKLKRLVFGLAFLFKAFWIAIRSTRHECLGSAVIFEGEKRYISNWAQSKSPTLSGAGFYRQDVPRDQITNVMSFAELRHRFIFGFDFYMGNWYGIDIQRRVYPELSKAKASE